MTPRDFIRTRRLAKRRVSMNQITQYPPALPERFALADGLELYATPKRDIQMAVSFRIKQFAILMGGRVLRGGPDDDVAKLG
jgi:hypothetical protein